jgi:hypothetical protein
MPSATYGLSTTDAFALEPGFALADADLFFIVIISFLFLPDVKMSAIFVW